MSRPVLEITDYILSGDQYHYSLDGVFVDAFSAPSVERWVETIISDDDFIMSDIQFAIAELFASTPKRLTAAIGLKTTVNVGKR